MNFTHDAMDPVVLYRQEAEKRGIRKRKPEAKQVDERVRRARRPCTRCRKEVMSTTAVERPLCHGCRRELKGLPRDKADRRAWWRENFRRRRAAERDAMSDTVTVTFTSRAAYEAAREAVREKATEWYSTQAGPSIAKLDTEDALQALERAGGA